MIYEKKDNEIKKRLKDIATENGRYQSKFIYRNNKNKKKIHKKRYKKKLYGIPWESIFMRKSNAEKREIIRKPWQFPTAAQHLAAISIQRFAKGMIWRLRLSRISKKSNKKEKKPVNLLKQFLSNRKNNYRDETGFKNFCASRIQAWIRMLPIRRHYLLERFPIYHIASMQIQFLYRSYIHRRNINYSGAIDPKLYGAKKIQNMWKRYIDKRIYRYYRDLLLFHNHSGNPALMLRIINPTEASLFDGALGVHVRFRLGGFTFPPGIYYKIFTHKAICDINAFSPKDYTKPKKIISHNKKNNKNKINDSKIYEKRYLRVGNKYIQVKITEKENDYWYKRIENNGWRSVTTNVLADIMKDPINEINTKKNNKISNYLLKLPKRQDILLHKKNRKREWMMKMYRDGLIKEKNDLDENDISSINFNSENWEEEATDLLEWSEGLDFDGYMDHWNELAMSGSSDLTAKILKERYINNDL